MSVEQTLEQIKRAPDYVAGITPAGPISSPIKRASVCDIDMQRPTDTGGDMVFRLPHHWVWARITCVEGRGFYALGLEEHFRQPGNVPPQYNLHEDMLLTRTLATDMETLTARLLFGAAGDAKPEPLLSLKMARDITPEFVQEIKEIARDRGKKRILGSMAWAKGRVRVADRAGFTCVQQDNYQLVEVLV